MFRALICAFLAFLYAAFISVTSMSVSMFFEDTLHLLPLGHAIVLIVFCGGGLGFIGWVKLRRGDALVNVACSLTSLATISVLTREGAVQQGDLSFAKISQVLKMVVMGVIATMAVCFLVFPQSARTKLRQNMIEMTAALSEMLGIITESFLEGSAEKLELPRFVAASNKNKKAYTTVDRLLLEAKLEHYVAGTEKEYRLEKRVVRCIQDITQSIGALRSAAVLQFGLLRQSNQFETENNGNNDGNNNDHGNNGNVPDLSSSMFSPPVRQSSMLSAFQEVGGSNDMSPARAVETDGPLVSESDRILEDLSPADIFGKFIIHLGPPMVSFSASTFSFEKCGI